MAKKYIMLVNGIVGMGGGQMYTNNKLSYMEKLGWTPFVFSGTKGQIVIPSLTQYDSMIKDELIAPPLIYSHRVVDRVLDKITAEIGELEEAVIESGSGQMALWGELLAKKLQCKHMVHLLDERPDVVVPEAYLDFYRFKLARRELSGINKNSLKLLFRGKEEINDANAYFLSSVCTNTVSEEITDSSLDLPPKDTRIVLGCIGRGEKAYIAVAARAFAKVIQKHPEILFRVIFIGASSDPRIEGIFQGVSNVDVTMAGYVYPIPGVMLDYIDVFMSSAGSAYITYRYGKPTISIDGVDSKAIGVMGYTTQNSLYRKEEPAIEPDQLLENVLFSDYLKQYTYVEAQKLDVEDVLRKHIEFLEESEKSSAYYPILQMSAAEKDKIKKTLVQILGEKGYIHIRPLLNTCQNVIKTRSGKK